MEKVKVEFWRCFGGIWEPQLRRNIDDIWVGSFRSLQKARATWTGIVCSLRGDEYCEDFFATQKAWQRYLFGIFSQLRRLEGNI